MIFQNGVPGRAVAHLRSAQPTRAAGCYRLSASVDLAALFLLLLILVPHLSEIARRRSSRTISQSPATACSFDSNGRPSRKSRHRILPMMNRAKRRPR